MEQGQVVDGWTIDEFIQKRGHSGIVARVRHADGRKGIMKIYLPRPGFRVSRFRYEDLFAASPIIAGFKPPHYGRGFIEGRPYFVVEEVTPLPATLPPDELKAVLLAAIRICYHLQLAGFYHADIKPDNMGRRADGSLVLFDFGCVLRIKKATRYPLAAGTDYYQSPEAQHGDVSDKSEIYSLSKSGIVLADAEGRIRFAHAFLAGTEKHPDERPKSYAALADLIENSESTFTDVVRLYSRIWNKVIIAACVTVGVIAIAYGSIMAVSYMHRRDMLEKASGELDRRGAEVDLIMKQGCKRFDSSL